MNWRIIAHHEVAKHLSAIPPDRRQRILDDLRELAGDPFRGLVKPLKGKAHKGQYRKVSGRYRIVFKPSRATRTVEVLAVLLRNEHTYQ